MNTQANSLIPVEHRREEVPFKEVCEKIIRQAWQAAFYASYAGKTEEGEYEHVVRFDTPYGYYYEISIFSDTALPPNVGCREWLNLYTSVTRVYTA